MANAEPLKKRQATIKGLVVIQLSTGKMTGMAVGIVATAGQPHTNGGTSIRGAIGEQMRSALSEAERYLRVEHPDLGGSDIEISFEERYSPKDGGSAGTAFAVLLRSLMEGYEIDSTVGITGDIAVNGTVQPIGGVTAKLKGCQKDGCTIAIIPKPNTPAVADMLVTADKIAMLQGLQIFAAEKVDDAVDIARKDRPENLKQAIASYGEVQQALAKRKIAALREPAVQATLKKVLQLAPNHVSAKFALDIAQNNGPRTMTRNGSLVEVFAAADPFRKAVVAGNNVIKREHLSSASVRQMQKDLLAIKSVTHPDVEGMRKALVAWIDAADRVLSAKQAITEADMRVINARRDALNKEFERLKTDEGLIEKMMREGY